MDITIADIATWGALIGEVGAFLAMIFPILKTLKKISDGQKCQLRNDMLHIYYKNREAKALHQYEYENFIILYEAYKELKGNSFIDKIYDEVKTWKVVP